jgi:hypothetical protein
MIGVEGPGKPSLWTPTTKAQPQPVPRDNRIASAAQALAYDSDVKKRRRKQIAYLRKSTKRLKPSRFSKPLPPTPQQPVGSLINTLGSIQTQTSIPSSQSLLDSFPEEISPISFILYRTTSEIPYPEMAPYPESPLSNR